MMPSGGRWSVKEKPVAKWLGSPASEACTAIDCRMLKSFLELIMEGSSQAPYISAQQITMLSASKPIESASSPWDVLSVLHGKIVPTLRSILIFCHEKHLLRSYAGLVSESVREVAKACMLPWNDLRIYSSHTYCRCRTT